MGRYFAFDVLEGVTAVGVEVWMPEGPALSKMRIQNPRKKRINIHVLRIDCRPCS